MKKYWYVFGLVSLLLVGDGSAFWGQMNARTIEKILQQDRGPSQSSPSRRFPRKNTRGLWTYVIAPHPDDEILCCARTIKAKKDQAQNIKIVFITNGDGLSHESNQESQYYGSKRRQESLQAARRLGVDPRDLIWLNFPDGSLAQLPEVGSFRSPATGQSRTNGESFAPRLAYNKTNVRSTLTKLFQKFSPAEIYLPSSDDTHPDHVAAGEIVQQAVKNSAITPLIHGYQVHGKTDGVATNEGLVWKKNLINLFQSQFHDEYHRRYLQKFAEWEESFSRIR